MNEMTDGVDRIQLAWDRELPGVPTRSIGVITRIWRIAKLLDDDRRQTMAREGMDVATRDLLSTLRRSGSPYRLTVGDLARQTLVTAGAMSQRVARAERDGLVARRPASDDRRSVLVELTPAGLGMIDRAVTGLLEHEDTLMSSLDDDQVDQLSDLLKILLADLTGRFGVDDRP